MKNFHHPLPEQTYAQLGRRRSAREAVDSYLRQQARKARQNAIMAYATEMAGTPRDLDADLESAGTEHLVKTCKVKR